MSRYFFLFGFALIIASMFPDTVTKDQDLQFYINIFLSVTGFLSISCGAIWLMELEPSPPPHVEPGAETVKTHAQQFKMPTIDWGTDRY